VATQPFKPAFLASAGQPPVPWERWITMFEDWLLAIGFPTGDEYGARKAALLQASLGTEGYRIYASLATDLRETYAAATTRVQDLSFRKAVPCFSVPSSRDDNVPAKPFHSTSQLFVKWLPNVSFRPIS